MFIINRFKKYLDYTIHVIVRNAPWNFKFINLHRSDRRLNTIGLIRVRNEELLLKDTLDHISNFVDGVVLFDDSSTDSSIEIAKNHSIVLDIIINKHWRRNRKWEETANRGLIHNYAKRYKPQWFFYFDADERFEGDIRAVLSNQDMMNGVNAVRISLLDAYMTPDDSKSFVASDRLYDFRRKFGIERRDIVMIWRNNGSAKYIYPDSREPAGYDEEETRTMFWCQHYGKAVSIAQWDDTCRYYVDNFPMYSDKWKNRIGKAIHDKSDFGTKLYEWNEAKTNSVKIH